MIQEYQRHQNTQEQAESLFDRIWLAGKFRRVWGKLTHTERNLRFLGDVEQSMKVTGHRSLGQRTVDLDKIVGTNGRPDRFDKHWAPVHRRDRNRWASVAVGLLEDVTDMPRVELIKVGDDYYVVDGNHRVSAAKALGKLFIDAEVTEWETEPLPDLPETNHP